MEVMAVETTADRLRVALELADAGITLIRQNLRRAHPAGSDDELDQLLSDWIERRPGALEGDCPGAVRRLDSE